MIKSLQPFSLQNLKALSAICAGHLLSPYLFSPDSTMHSITVWRLQLLRLSYQSFIYFLNHLLNFIYLLSVHFVLGILSTATR